MMYGRDFLFKALAGKKVLKSLKLVGCDMAEYGVLQSMTKHCRSLPRLLKLVLSGNGLSGCNTTALVTLFRLYPVIVYVIVN
ncbi:hypothetical protein KIPB_015232 [Kipferlia bialata]|uniref:Uncharacterized protein n=1 Tax=Kipferlia bialata TaxID=797122 RepID=A0A9K3D9U7_9EUKA|nr:hypothetical protein KIPB_015232 [Kipferlia bialata]|eukprot:g15232.t1